MTDEPTRPAARPVDGGKRGRAPKADRLRRPRRRPRALQRLRSVLRANLDVPADAPDDDTWELPETDAAVQEPSDEAVIAEDADDPLPEHALYRDEGCHIAPSCLSCPLAACIYDGPQRSQERQRRDREIRALGRAGWSTARVAERVALSRGQVRRILFGVRRKRP